MSTGNGELAPMSRKTSATGQHDRCELRFLEEASSRESEFRVSAPMTTGMRT